MFSIIYTPTEGDAIENYSRLFRKPEGCFLNIRDQHSIESHLSQFGNEEDIDYIVVSDGEEVRACLLLPYRRPSAKKNRSWESETKVLVVFSSLWPNL